MLRYFFTTGIDRSARHCGGEIVIRDLRFVFPLVKGNASNELNLVGCFCGYLKFRAGVGLCIKLV